MFDRSAADPELADLPMSERARRRADVAKALAEAEARWLQSAEMLEQQAA